MALAALVISDAGTASQLAWLGAGAAAVALVVGMVAQSPSPVHGAVALLGAIFLLRRDTRLVLAPAYGGGLLLLEDLAIQAIELRAVDRIRLEVPGARTAATLAAAAVGAVAAAVAALAVTAAPGRSVGLTALGAAAAVGAFAAITRSARRRFRAPASSDRD